MSKDMPVAKQPRKVPKDFSTLYDDMQNAMQEFCDDGTHDLFCDLLKERFAFSGEVKIRRKDAQFLYRTCLDMLGMVNRDGYISVTRFGVSEIKRLSDWLGTVLSAMDNGYCNVEINDKERLREASDEK